jgi:hypothetical protein
MIPSRRAVSRKDAGAGGYRYAVSQKPKKYNKLGYKNMIKGIKALYFENTSCKMNRRECEEFFRMITILPF